MPIRTRLASLWRNLFRKDRVEQELAQEVEAYLEMLVETKVKEGLQPAEARRAALIEMGGAEQVKERVREVRIGRTLETMWQDLRYGARMLVKNPGFTLIAIITLALGIGANTSIFSVIDAVLLKTLPVKDPEQLVVLVTDAESGSHSFSYPLFQELRDRNQIFGGIFAYDGVVLNLSEGGQTERVNGELVSGNYFSTLGVKPLLGRDFSEEDDKTPGAHPVAVLSYSFWQRRFAGDTGMVGKPIHLNGSPFTIVGISSPGFFGVEVGSSPDIWVPMMMQPQVSAGLARLHLWNNFWGKVMARLKPSVAVREAQVATDTLYKQIIQEAPINSGLRSFLLKKQIHLRPASKGLSSLRNQYEHPLLILMGTVGLVLLIACANVANLLLARAATRQKEIAVRLALGAGRLRLARQLLTESILLSLLGGLLGLLFAFWATDLFLSFLSNTHITLELHLDFRVLSFNFCVAALTGMLFGLAPSIQATRPNLITAINNAIPTLVCGGSRFELRKILVVAQVALSLLLLIGAVLFVRTLQNLKGVDLGFRADKVLLLSMNPGLNGYRPDQVGNFYAQLLDQVKALPGMQSASFADMPLLGGVWIDGISVEGYQAQSGQDMSTTAKTVDPKFFETMGIPLHMGRDFNAEDGPDAPGVAIINETLVRDFFGNGNPIGRRIGVGSEKPDREIIGIIKDTKYSNLKEKVPRTVYIPFAQSSPRSDERTLHVRAAGDPKSLIAAIRDKVQALDQNLPVYNVRTFTELVAESIIQERLIATLSSFFGLLALLLALIGLYGVMAYTVASRTHEIGIRLALGAQRSDVLKLVISQGMKLALVGLVIGLVAAFGLTRLMKSLLFAVSPTDPLTFLVVASLLALAALLACYLPARRATKVDPIVLLRYE